MNAKDVLMALLRSEVCGGALTEELKSALTADCLAQVYSLSKVHDLAHIAGQALGKLGVLGNDEISAQLRRQSMLAMMRHAQLEHEYNRICNTLSLAQLPFIPLKGSVLRAHYPEGWMRTSCDIDVLVKEEDLEAAVAALTNKLGYRRGKKSTHDISLHSAGGVHLELHYTAVEDGRARNAREVLEEIWEHAAPAETDPYHYYLSDDMFYFYHIAHMAKHIEEGGCGIRTFLDLWILNHRLAHDRQTREKMLSRGELLAFAKVAEKLSEMWFSGAEEDFLARHLERFVICGGMFGSVENNIAVKQSERGGRLGYAMTRIFPPYEKMKFRYPVLERRKWLLPVYHVIRWFTVLHKGNGMQSLRELEKNASISDTAVKCTEALMEQLGL